MALKRKVSPMQTVKLNGPMMMRLSSNTIVNSRRKLVVISKEK